MSRDREASAPTATIAFGRTTRMNSSNRVEQALISLEVGFLIFPPRDEAVTQITALVNVILYLSNPASSISSVSNVPAGPENGSSVETSKSEAESPTNRISHRAVPR